MANIEIYSKEWCPYCTKAKALLRSKDLTYDEVDISSDAEGEQTTIHRSKRMTVPQIFIDDNSIGGYDDLAQLNTTGALDKLLNIEAGDVTASHDKQIIIAAGAGANVALGSFEYLVAQH